MRDDGRKKITVFLDDALHERLVLAGLRCGVKLQGALVEGAEAWLAGKERHGSTETDGAPVVPSVLSKDNPDWRDAVPDELRGWLNLVERATHVRNKTWLDMLASIRRQLELVAGIADAEPEPPAKSGIGAGSPRRTPKPSGDGGTPRVPAHPRTGT